MGKIKRKKQQQQQHIDAQTTAKSQNPFSWFVIAILFVFGKFISIHDDNASSVAVATAATAATATAIITYIVTAMIK